MFPYTLGMHKKGSIPGYRNTREGLPKITFDE